MERLQRCQDQSSWPVHFNSNNNSHGCYCSSAWSKSLSFFSYTSLSSSVKGDSNGLSHRVRGSHKLVSECIAEGRVCGENSGPVSCCPCCCHSHGGRSLGCEDKVSPHWARPLMPHLGVLNHCRDSGDLLKILNLESHVNRSGFQKDLGGPVADG